MRRRRAACTLERDRRARGIRGCAAVPHARPGLAVRERERVQPRDIGRVLALPAQQQPALELGPGACGQATTPPRESDCGRLDQPYPFGFARASQPERESSCRAALDAAPRPRPTWPGAPGIGRPAAASTCNRRRRWIAVSIAVRRATSRSRFSSPALRARRQLRQRQLRELRSEYGSALGLEHDCSRSRSAVFRVDRRRQAVLTQRAGCARPPADPPDLVTVGAHFTFTEQQPQAWARRDLVASIAEDAHQAGDAGRLDPLLQDPALSRSPQCRSSIQSTTASCGQASDQVAQRAPSASSRVAGSCHAAALGPASAAARSTDTRLETAARARGRSRQ